MKTLAAVLRGVGEPFEVAEVELAEPGPGEVRVRIEASGVCHSDWNAATGASATPLPAVLGHEGCGVVEAAGPAVTAVSPGDTVVLSFLPACGQCRACQQGRPALCETATRDMAAGSLPGGGFRIFQDGRRLHHYSYLSTFARHAVVDERCCIRLPAGTDPDVAALVGCAVTTGVGAVINRAKVSPGSTVAVFGAGGVGLSAIMGAHLAGADTIVAVDLSGPRRALALEVGATLALDGNDPALAEALLDCCPGGVDYAFEAAGLPPLLELAFSVTRPGGMIVAIGVPPDGSVVSFPGPQLVRSEKIVTGTFYGSARPAIDMPMILRLHAEGRLPLGKLVGRRYRLAEVNEAFADLRSPTSARGVLRPWEEGTATP
jgi:S-(hydroxymethyl)glutathione dehydrogenase/alcohol dehydrogenase